MLNRFLWVMPNGKPDPPQSGGAVGGEGGWSSENDGWMKALWGPGSSTRLGCVDAEIT
jgi:hypothetical protein